VSIRAGPVHLFEFHLEPNVWHVNICATVRVHSSFELVQLFLTFPFSSCPHVPLPFPPRLPISFSTQIENMKDDLAVTTDTVVLSYPSASPSPKMSSHFFQSFFFTHFFFKPSIASWRCWFPPPPPPPPPCQLPLSRFKLALAQKKNKTGRSQP
jgi:hypothetical protein